jgi:hypothetical protein
VLVSSPLISWQRDEAREKEERELEEARGKYDRLLLAWATDNGLKRNVRTLLSTMHVCTALSL